MIIMQEGYQPNTILQTLLNDLQILIIFVCKTSNLLLTVIQVIQLIFKYLSPFTRLTILRTDLMCLWVSERKRPVQRDASFPLLYV